MNSRKIFNIYLIHIIKKKEKGKAAGITYIWISHESTSTKCQNRTSNSKKEDFSSWRVPCVFLPYLRNIITLDVCAEDA